MRGRRITAWILSAVLALSLTGCRSAREPLSSSEPPVSAPVQSQGGQTMTLLYSNADTLNPYTAKTEQNRQLCRLLYDPLFKTDEAYRAVPVLAESAVNDGAVWTVTLRSAVFTDGSPVTANDVLYSYQLARASATAYASKLYEVQSVSAAGSAVVFRLSRVDPYFPNVLDFPVLKADSDKRADSDSVLLPPIGSGRYLFDENEKKLTAHARHLDGVGTVREIRLIHTPDQESMAHYVEVGAADMFYSDISDGTILRMSGKKRSVNLNHLVYIGVNRQYGSLAENAVRQALSSALDRKAICRNAYYNNAVPAKGLYHPAWNEVKSVQNIQTEANQEITIENLQKIGYNNLDSKGRRIGPGGSPLSFTLLVNKENSARVAAANLIAEQLAACGIEIRVTAQPYESYVAALSAGTFQLYLAEVVLTENMDASPLLLKGGSAAYGIEPAPAAPSAEGSAEPAASGEPAEGEPPSGGLSEVVTGFYAGRNSITDIASVFQSEMPLIPLCYRSGILFYSDRMEQVTGSSASDIFFSVGSYTIKQ